jgi:hypothetical protein
MVFNFMAPALTSRGAPWKPSAPDTNGWSFPPVWSSSQVRVRPPEGKEVVIRLEEDQVVTASALLPPAPP